ncbi:hypothetical protein F5Y03DRAFT_340637 [Xylaria venustula]|nr:hypothetical protein F5Y03DRAFT_340637 [Xylaria venustula]
MPIEPRHALVFSGGTRRIQTDVSASFYFRGSKVVEKKRRPRLSLFHGSNSMVDASPYPQFQNGYRHSRLQPAHCLPARTRHSRTHLESFLYVKLSSYVYRATSTYPIVSLSAWIPRRTANHVRSIIAILPIALRRGQGSTAPKIVRWYLFFILSESYLMVLGHRRRQPRIKVCMSRECCFLRCSF